MTHSLVIYLSIYVSAYLFEYLSLFSSGVCSCAINDDEGTSRAIQLGYWELLEEWINTNGTYDGIDDFSVVLQPQLRDMPAPYTVIWGGYSIPDLIPFSSMK